MKKLLQYKEIIVLVIAVAGIYLWVGDAKQTNVQAEENKQHLKKVDIILEQVYKDIKHSEGKLEGFLEGMKIDPENARKWARMPQKPVTDDEGNLITGVPWVKMSDDIQLGIAYQFQRDDDDELFEVLVDTLWDVREK